MTNTETIVEIAKQLRKENITYWYIGYDGEKYIVEADAPDEVINKIIEKVTRAGQ